MARRVERGEKLLQKGKPAEALEEFLQTLAMDPDNETVRQMAADLCLSLQRLPEAVRLLGELFERQVASGDGMRASLTYKKLARFATPNTEQKVRFAELLEKSNRKLSLETYEAAIEDYTRLGRKPDALALLKKVVALEASERNMLRLAELSSETGDAKQAAAAFLSLAKQAESSGGDPTQWYERAYGEDATNDEISLGYARGLIQQQQVGAAIFVLDPMASAGNSSPDFRELYSKALLSANRLSEASPLVWQIFEQNPSRIEQVRDLIGALLDSQLDNEAVVLAKKLEHFQRCKGERRAFLTMMQDIVAGHRASVEMLEFLADQFNTANREADYCTTLLKLFDQYCELGKFLKAGDALDRAAEIDSYEPGHQKRLAMLKGKIDDNRYQVIASRFSSTSPVAPARPEEKTVGGGTLQDLMLQAEILVQYGMRNKALERLQRIQQLFPHEEERNPDLHQLYMSAGMLPQYAPGSGPATAAAPSSAPEVQSAVPDMTGFAKIPEITRKLNQQSTAQAVLSAAANEIGMQWNLDRCVVALRKPGLAISSLKEFHAENARPAKSDVFEDLICRLHDVAVTRGSMVFQDVSSAEELKEFSQQLTPLGVRSLLVVPLGEGPESLGVMLLISSVQRKWTQSDALVFKTIAEQAAIALSNAGLRRLVKTLSVTDENSGLLNRASYLDLLMGEIRRARQQATPTSVLLMRFTERPAPGKDQGEVGADAMQRMGQVVAANIRQNDLAFRYTGNTIAIVLGETSEKEAMLAVEKMRRVISAAAAKQSAAAFNAGVAEAVLRQEFDPVDIVTEVINRAERALENSIAEGMGASAALAPNLVAAAVA